MLVDPEVGHSKAAQFCYLHAVHLGWGEGGRNGHKQNKTNKNPKQKANKSNQNKKRTSEQNSSRAMACSLFYSLHIHTYLLFIWDAHDLHCLHGLLKHVFVLLTRDRNMPIGKEAVFVVRLQQQIILGKN